MVSQLDTRLKFTVDVDKLTIDEGGLMVQWLGTWTTDPGVRDSNLGRTEKYFLNALVSPTHRKSVC